MDSELYGIYGAYFNINSRPDLMTQKKGELSNVVEKPTIEKHPSSSNLEDELAILEKKYGRLKGKSVQVSLSDMLDMKARHRRKIDAYNGLMRNWSVIQ